MGLLPRVQGLSEVVVKDRTLLAKGDGCGDIMRDGDLGDSVPLAFRRLSHRGCKRGNGALFDVLAISKHNILRLQRYRAPALPSRPPCSGLDGCSAPLPLFLGSLLLLTLPFGFGGGRALFNKFDRRRWGACASLMRLATPGSRTSVMLGHSENQGEGVIVERVEV